MENNTTKAPNGDGKTLKPGQIPIEEGKERETKTESCNVIVIDQKEVNSIAGANIMASQIVPPNKIKDGIRPQDQKDSVYALYGIEFNGELRMVTDAEKGRTEQVEKQPENRAQVASREKLEIQRSAEEKYKKNQEGSQER